MTPIPRLDILGAALGDASRARMLCELMDGRAYTNKELASAARITPQTASTHLQQLEAAGLTVSAPSGRCRYHRIAGPAIAETLEALSELAPSDHLYRSQQKKGARQNMLAARSCYDHLAGHLGVAICDALLAKGLLMRADDRFRAVAGPEWATLGVTSDPDMLTARACLDWTERKPHLGGPLGRRIMAHAFEQGWVIRAQGQRGLTITASGADAFSQILGIAPETLTQTAQA